jgi:mRNA interferase MazF
VKRGDIWLARLGATRGAEVGKTRPVLVMQDNALTAANLATVIVLPLTRDVRPDAAPFRVTIPARGELESPSQVITAQPRSLDRERFVKGPLTRLLAGEMANVEKGLLAALGLNR